MRCVERLLLIDERLQVATGNADALRVVDAAVEAGTLLRSLLLSYLIAAAGAQKRGKGGEQEQS